MAATSTTKTAFSNNNNKHKKNSSIPSFNPWTDFRFRSATNNDQEHQQYYSSMRCALQGTKQDLYVKMKPDELHQGGGYGARSCWYRNLYYDIREKTFHYFASPQETALWELANQTNRQSFISELQGQRSVAPGMEGDPPWEPIWHPFNELYKRNSTILTTERGKVPYLVAYRPSFSFNFGHFIFDDVWNIFSLLDTFDLLQSQQHDDDDDDDHVVVPFYIEIHDGSDARCSPHNHHPWRRWPYCVALYRRLYASFMGVKTMCGDILRPSNWFASKLKDFAPVNDENCSQSPSSYNQSLPELQDVSHVMIPHFLIGTGALGIVNVEPANGPSYWRFRNYLLDKLFGRTRATELVALDPQGYIVFNIPGDSSRQEKVTNFSHEILATTKRYGRDLVKAVDFSTLSAPKQAELMMNAAILFTNHGGGSASSIFLPMGATQLSFYHAVEKGRGFKRHNEYTRMDSGVYKSVAHYETIYISEPDRALVNRTMSIVETQLFKMAQFHPNLTFNRSQASK